MSTIKTFTAWLNEAKRPTWKDSDAPDANGRFRDLGIKALAKWLIRTRKGDMRKITGSLNQQIVFNRGDNPAYAKKMEKVRAEVKRQLGKNEGVDQVRESRVNCAGHGCSWGWALADGGENPLLCHKCGTQNIQSAIHNSGLV